MFFFWFSLYHSGITSWVIDEKKKRNEERTRKNKEKQNRAAAIILASALAPFDSLGVWGWHMSFIFANSRRDLDVRRMRVRCDKMNGNGPRGIQLDEFQALVNDGEPPCFFLFLLVFFVVLVREPAMRAWSYGAEK